MIDLDKRIIFPVSDWLQATYVFIFRLDIAANISNGETSLEFNDTTSGSSVILDNSLQGKGSRPSSIAGILYKSINEIFPAVTSHEQQTR